MQHFSNGGDEMAKNRNLLPLSEGLKPVLADYNQVDFIDVQVESRRIVIYVAINHTSGEAFFTGLGAIHGVIAEYKHNGDLEIIRDITGQEITVEMSNLISAYRKGTTHEEFRKNMGDNKSLRFGVM